MPVSRIFRFEPASLWAAGAARRVCASSGGATRSEATKIITTAKSGNRIALSPRPFFEQRIGDAFLGLRDHQRVTRLLLVDELARRLAKHDDRTAAHGVEILGRAREHRVEIAAVTREMPGALVAIELDIFVLRLELLQRRQ